MSQADREAVQALTNQLTVYQQQQVRTQCEAYRATLAAKKIAPDKMEQACFVFYRTMVEKLFEISRKSSVVKFSAPVPPPPPPPSAPRNKTHPLAMPKLVDMWVGLVARLLGGKAPPVGLQDWVNRAFLRPEAAHYVTKTIHHLVQNGQVGKINWITFPVSNDPVIAIDLEPAPKARRTSPQDFIPVSAAAPVHRRPARTAMPGLDSEEVAKRNQRAEKYKEHLLVAGPASPEIPAENVSVKYEFGGDEDDMFGKTEQYAVVGTCMNMEKRYLRLTAAPDPAQVRPEPVLVNWLMQLEKLWEGREKEWKYIEDQMRAIRQDLTVQNLRGPFAAKVYELNARWALESGDLGQFNQCQTQLKQLHAYLPDTHIDTKCEFLSYRLLYYFFQNLRVDEQLFLHQLISQESVRNHPFIKSAMALRSAATTNNFSKYFALVKQARDSDGHTVAPHTKFLLNAFDAKQKIAALIVLTRAIATPVSVAWLTDVMGFETITACSAFLKEHGAVMKSETHVDPKASFAAFSNSPLLVSSKLKLMG